MKGSSLQERSGSILVIEGGKSLSGEVEISGAKNAALPLMSASLLFSSPFSIHHMPDLGDIFTMMQLLDVLGVHSKKKNHVLEVNPKSEDTCEAPYELVKKMRASILVLGPLLTRRGRAVVSLPGGCSIGARPVDLHLRGLEAMGARIRLQRGNIVAEADRLRGAEIVLDFATVTGTENLVMAGTLADGKTVIRNAAKEPEVVELCRFLKASGADISGEGTDTITINGVKELQPPEKWELLPDRIEAGTFLIAGALTAGDLVLRRVVPEHLTAVVDKLRTAGGEVEAGKDWMRIRRVEDIQPVNIKTAPYPGFPTDMQAQFAVLLSIAKGDSIIHETIFENRFQYVPELVRMGADIRVEDRVAFIKGVKELSGAPVTATDLRASASLVLAGLIASGETIIYDIYHLDRGYERLDDKLKKVGAKIERITVEE